MHCEILKFYDASLLMIFMMEVLNKMTTLWLFYFEDHVLMSTNTVSDL